MVKSSFHARSRHDLAMTTHNSDTEFNVIRYVIPMLYGCYVNVMKCYITRITGITYITKDNR